MTGIVRFLCVICFLAGSVSAAKGNTGDGLLLLTAKLRALTSMQASFEQKQIAADGFELRTTSGKLQVERPGRMRWITDPPYEQWIISSGQKLWIYDPDLEQVTLRDFDANVANSPVMLLTGEVAEVANTHQIIADQQGDSFTLIPRDKHSPYDQIKLQFDGNIPVYIAMTDSLGEKTAISFSKVTINPALDSELFNFVPPNGVDIIHNE